MTGACDRADERRAAPGRGAPVASETPRPLEPAVAGGRGRQADVGARRLAVVARLVDLLEPGDASLASGRCPIDDERRPALGCTRWRVAAERTIGRDPPEKPLVVDRPDGGGPPRPQMLQWSLQGSGKVFDEPRPATIFGATETTLPFDPSEIAGPAPAPPGTRMTLRARPTLPERVRTLPVSVPPGSSIELGLAIDITMPHDDVEAVDFALSAETPDGEQPLFEARLVTGDPAVGRWTDHRVALDRLAGSEVRFVFTTRLVPRAGGDPSRIAALPLWGAPEILAPSDDPALDLILISFDTLRADHVGAYGSDLPTTPHLDQLAAEGVVFDDVFATYPSTTVSHMSMLTGLYPVTHGALSVGRPLRRDVPSLAAVLGARGWRTGAVTEDGMLRAESGFSRGVSFYREHGKAEELGKPSLATATFDTAVRWIAAHAGERFFLFVHTYVVHWPYEPPPEFDVFRTAEDAGAAPPVGPGRNLEALRRRYAGEARYGDALFGGLRAELSRLGLANRTLIVVTSDHGEEFGEHGGWSHSRTLYDEVLHVPLIFWAPRHLGGPRRIPGPASLVDLMPTVLDVLDVPAPPGLEGLSLLAAAPANDRVVFADVALSDRRRVMARTRDAKWVWDFKDGSVVEAFDLRADPRERQPVADAAFRERGAPYLADYLNRAPAPPAVPATAPDTPPDAPTDPATIEKLRALGYVQ